MAFSFMDSPLPVKANRVLNLIILGLLLILIRVWYLTVVKHEEHLTQARRPQRRSVIERVERATIRDRFNIPLALNKIQYNAAICYADIRDIPRIAWETGQEGKRARIYPRATYIKKLAAFLGQELSLDPQQIEDTIQGHACLFPHTPFILKENIAEAQFYHLKLLEKDWAGIRMERGSVRSYPQGRVGSDVIGYLGAIDSKEYLTIAQEIVLLQSYILERETGENPFLPPGFHNPLEVRERLKQLQEKAYTINDLVGKAGIEQTFDAELRGYYGKKMEEVDVKGNVLRELPGSRKAISGQRILLSLSSELQEFSEQLLADNERFREIRHPDGSPLLSHPWIKGGAIVAMDPHTGEVLSLASYPRFDPNDFIPSHSVEARKQKQKALAHWLENESYVGAIWDGKRPLERERFDRRKGGFYEEPLDLSWDRYLEAILSKKSSLFKTMQHVANLSVAVALQQDLETLLQLSEQSDMGTLLGALYGEEAPSDQTREARAHLSEKGAQALVAKKAVDTYLQAIPNNQDKLLLIDLCRMVVHNEAFSPELLEHVGGESLSSYRSLCQSAAVVQGLLLSHAQGIFHQTDFRKWRDTHFKEHLRAKRKEEKEKKHYARAYTEYLEQCEKREFKAFWENQRWILLEALLLGAPHPYLPKEGGDALFTTHADKLKQKFSTLPQSLLIPYLKTMRSFEELNRPLYGTYSRVRKTQGVQLEKHLAAAFYPLSGYGYGRSQAYRQSTPQGSVFKLVVAYQALLEKYQALGALHRNFEALNPLTLVDMLQRTIKPGSNQQVLGFTLEGEPYLRLHKGGRLPRSHPNIGKIDLIGALEQSSNLYFALLAGESIQDPSHLLEASRLLGFGTRTGIELPGEISGSLPNDLLDNRTGLYSFAIGQHSLVVTPLQTAVMLSAIANRGEVLTPKIVQVIAGSEPFSQYHDPFDSPSFDFQEDLALIGIDFPLFTATQEERSSSHIWCSSPESKRRLFMPDEIRNPLLEGMRRVISGPRGTARPNVIRMLHEQPERMRNYQNLKHEVAGKTGTAEILYKQTIDSETLAEIQNHIWCAGISFAENQPELVVVVYLRFSEAGGKEAAPLVLEVVKKWREIRAAHGCSSYVDFQNAKQPRSP